MSDSLLSDVAAGRPDAVNRCIRRFSGPVWSLARRMSPTEQDAEDAVQEVFLDLWRSAARFDANAGSELTFVLTITRRRLIDRSRRRGRTPAMEVVETDTLPATTQPDNAEIKDESVRVRAAMDRLRPEQRSVLELALIQGSSHQQIAARTGLALGTVKSHARRGLMRVREMLGVDTTTRQPAASPKDPR